MSRGLMEEKLPMASLYSSALAALPVFGRLIPRPRTVPPGINKRRPPGAPPTQKSSPDEHRASRCQSGERVSYSSRRSGYTH